MADKGLTSSSDMCKSIDWAKFLSNLDIDWPEIKFKGTHFYNNTKLQTIDWGDNAFIGNGMIGAGIYKDSIQDLKWEFGRNDVEAHNTIHGVDWCIPRVPIGSMLLQPVGKIKQESMQVSLWNAEASGIIETDRGTINWVSIAHAKRDLIVIEISTIGNECGCFMEFAAEYGVSPRLAFVQKEEIPKACPMPPKPYMLKQDDINLSIQQFIKDDKVLEGECAVAWKEVTIEKGRRVFYISIKNSYFNNSARDEAIECIKAACQISVEELKVSHRKWWHEYYPQSFVSLPEKKWEQFYWIQMYKLASVTRGEMDEPIDNQGIWLTKTAWPGTWWNLNVQLSYCSLYKANRLNIAESLLRTLENNVDKLCENAKTLGISDGLCINRTSGRRLISECPSYEEIVASDKEPDVFELGNLTWVLHSIWRHYRSLMDDNFLKDRLFPLLRGSINVYLRLLKKGEDGRWHLPKTVSPEYPGPINGTAYPAHDTNYDLALLRWGCRTLLDANNKLGLKDSLAEKWQDVLDNIVDFSIDENGLMVASEIHFTKTHRHYSHLLAIYPLHLFDIQKSSDLELITKSFKHWMSLQEVLMGYSYTGAACMAATIGDGNQALNYLNGVSNFLLSNTLYMEAGGPVIETPLSGAESIHYMLMQCWGDTIRVFPAVADEWKNVSFAKLLAEGAFEITANRKDGRNEFVVVTSLAGSPLKIMPNLLGKVKVAGNRIFKLEETEEGVYTIDLEKDESVLLYTGESVPDISIKE